MDKHRATLFHSIICRLVPITLSIMLASCFPAALSEPTMMGESPTEVAVTSIPSMKAASTRESTSTPWTRRTKTPTTTWTPHPPTNTPIPCPPFSLDTKIPQPDLPENYIGRHYDLRNLPEGLEELGGSITRDQSGTHEFAVNSFAWKENRTLYWLEKLMCRDQDGMPYFEIVDAIATPPLKGDETDAWVCIQDDREVDFWVALGRYDPSTPEITIRGFTGWPYAEILFAFQLDFENGRFNELDPTGWICLEDHGVGPDG